MEDEQGAVGQGSGGGDSASSLSGNLPSESLVENMGSDNQVEESFQEGDGGEIMVEIVGSDVFVDGVRDHKEGRFESGEAGDLGGHVAEESESRNFSEAKDVSREGDGNKVGESDLGLSELREEKHLVVTEEVDGISSKSVGVEGDAVSALPSNGVDAVDDEVWNPGIEAVDGSTSAASVPTEEVRGPSPMVISEEKMTEDEAVNKDTAELTTTPEPLNHPAEAVSDEKADISEGNEVLLSTDNSASHDHVGPDSAMSHGETKAAHDGLEPAEVSLNPNSEGPQDIQVDGIGSVVEEAQIVNASPGGELLDSGGQKDGSFRAKAECTSTDGDGAVENKSVDEKEVLAAESKDSILKLDAVVSDVKDENQGCLNEFHGVKLESNDQKDGVSNAAPESIHENSLVSERKEAIGNDECLKTDGDLETCEAHENHVVSNEPIQLTDGGDTAVVDEDKCLNVEIQDDKVENEPNMMNLSDKEIVQADSGMYSNQPVIATTVDAEMDDQNVVISQEKIVDRGGSEKSEEINSEIPRKSLESQGNAEIAALDDSTANMHLPAEGECSMVETAAVTVTEDHVVCHNPVVNSEAGSDNVAEECGQLQNTKQEVSVQINETSNHEVDKLASINLMPNEVAGIAAVSDVTQACILPERTEEAEFLASSTNIFLVDGGDTEEKPDCDMPPSDELNKSMEADDKPRESNGFHMVEGHTSETKLMDVEEEGESDRSYHSGQEADAELGTEGPSSETDKSKLSNEETMKYASSLRMNQSGYLTAPENEGRFAQSDLVWGKVRSHPWWPGQIFDPADASEKAVKYYKKDSYLVAYFGDQTFAWNDSSALKPFRSHFSQIEKQSNSEAFQNAVSCALEEVERRVELGLACSCIPKDAHAKIEAQVVENTGIREEAGLRYGVDQSSRASHFEPDKFLEYVTALAPRASSLADRLDLVVAGAQLSAFCRFKGYRSPTEFPSSGELLETDADTVEISDEMVALHKHKPTPKDGSQSRKERSLTELMGDTIYSPDAEDEPLPEDLGKSVSLSSGKKRKALDPPADGSDKRVSVYAAKISTSASQTPKPSFKIGECIRRVASQLTGSTSLVKGSNDEMVLDGSPNIYENSEKQTVVVSAESLSVDDMLSQLQLLAQDPKKRHNIQNNIRAFFMGFRSSIALNRRGRKKKSEQTIGGSGEEFEFDDVNDSYWTDRIVQNYSEEQLLHDSENGAGNLHLVPFGAEKSVKPGRKPHSRKRFSSGNSPTAANEEDENAKRRKQESSPAELILNFAERNYVPSEINLNKMFRRFGPLMESETEVDHESGCAKVIFKRGSDAEVARNSAEKFNIFGPVLVNYQIGYSPVISVKILPVAVPQPQEDATLML